MDRRLMPMLAALALGAVTGCASFKPQLTYDRFDARSRTYVNDTAGFALRLGSEWRVTTDVDWTAKIFELLPLPTATEVSLKAMTSGVGLWIETTPVSSTMSLDQLQPAIVSSYGEQLRQFRYTPVSLEKRRAHGIEYVEWVYQLRSPDFDQTMMEGLFVKDGFAVRVRAKADSAHLEALKDRFRLIMGSLTALEAAGPTR